MSERIHALAYRLFGKASVEECDLDEVQHYAKQHPHFAPAQFLLLQKLKQTGSNEYTAQLQKAVLYYHNPLEFEYFINSERFYTELTFDKKEENKTSEDLVETSGEQQFVGIDEKPEPQLVAQPEATVEEIISISEKDENEKREISSAPTHHHEIKAEQETEELQPAISNVSEQRQTTSEITAEKEKTSNTINDPQTPNPILRQAQGQTPNSPDLTFEPYHTVDYFASQGIRLSQEEVSSDKFGRQLKSFTEWLKSMKRLPAPDVQKPETASEQNVQHMAEGSIHQSDVVTEAMAEVWLKQGATQKAIETYNKLSLLNPSKRAYFAAKIDHLKST